MAGMGYGRHLGNGSKAPPPPEKDVLRIYGMKFCPYVQRLKLVLAAKNIEHETVNIDLCKKPDWYLKKNPTGRVPTLERNGVILYESDITSCYADEAFPGRKLTSDSALQRAKEKILFSHYASAISQGYYGNYLAKKDDVEKKKSGLVKLENGLQYLETYLEDTELQFFGSDKPGITDYMMWPHMERMLLFFPDTLAKFPLLSAFIERMGKDKAVIKCRHSDELMREFGRTYLAKKPSYEIGEVESYSFDK